MEAVFMYGTITKARAPFLHLAVKKYPFEEMCFCGGGIGTKRKNAVGSGYSKCRRRA